MRAAVLFGPNDLRIVDKPVPVPRPGEVLVEVAMCGTCGTDLKLQTHPFPASRHSVKFTPGHGGQERSSRSAKPSTSCQSASESRSRRTTAAVVARTASGHVHRVPELWQRGQGSPRNGHERRRWFCRVRAPPRRIAVSIPDTLTWEDAVLVTTRHQPVWPGCGRRVRGRSVGRHHWTGPVGTDRAARRAKRWARPGGVDWYAPRSTWTSASIWAPTSSST